MYTRSVERALDILECFCDNDELTLNEIAHNTKLSATTVLRIINSLQKRGYVNRNLENKKYYLGSAFNKFVNHTDRTNSVIVAAAGKYLDEIHKKYDENVRLFVREGEYRLCIDMRESNQALRQVIRIGDRKKIDTAATGTLFLAYMSEKERERVAMAVKLTLDPEKLEDALIDGYSLSKDSSEAGILAIAAPIFNKCGDLIASLSLSGPAYRFVNKYLTDKIDDVLYYARRITEELSIKE